MGQSAKVATYHEIFCGTAIILVNSFVITDAEKESQENIKPYY